MATVNLGRIKPVFRGAYNNSTSYVVDDIVTFGNETFIAIQAGSGNATSNASYWTKLAAKGTDGTDVGTTLTTQGDILYRDGSGLQRLPKGTAGQVLKMNAAANAPEYGNLSSDWVKLVSTTISSATASVTLADFFSSDYMGYKIFISNFKKAGSTDESLRFRFKYGSTVVSNSTYRGGYEGVNYNNSNAASQQQGGFWDANSGEISNWNMPDTRQSNNGTNIEMFIPEITTNTDKHYHYLRSNLHASGTYINWSCGMGYCTDATLRANDMTASGSGIQFFPVSDDIASGQFTVFGLKK
jgi:hypothetical protein